MPRKENEPDRPGKGPQSGLDYVARVAANYPGLLDALPFDTTRALMKRHGLNKKAIRYLRRVLAIPSPYKE